MNPAYDSLYRYAQNLTERIVAAAGSGAIRAIFAGGSLASGRITWCRADSHVEVFSDVDLYVVVTRDHDRDRVAAIVRDAVEKAGSGEGDVVLLGGTDAGTYAIGELLALGARPGTVSLSETHAHLYGDETIYDGMRDALGGEIAEAEGLYLIENRVAGLAGLAAPGGDAAQRMRRYAVAKLVLDVAAGHLIALGRYRSARENQRAELTQLEGAVSLSAAELGLFDAALAACTDLARVPEGGDASLETRALAMALAVWRRDARRLYPRATSWPEAVEMRCGRGKVMSNLRTFVAMRAAHGRSKLRALGEGLWLSRMNPRDAVRLAPLAAFAAESRAPSGAGEFSAFFRHVDRLTRTFGCAGSTTLDRALHLYRATH